MIEMEEFETIQGNLHEVVWHVQRQIDKLKSIQSPAITIDDAQDLIDEVPKLKDEVDAWFDELEETYRVIQEQIDEIEMGEDDDDSDE